MREIPSSAIRFPLRPVPEMRVRSLAVLVALATAVPLAAQETQGFHSRAAYSVQLPAGWQAMPDEEVDALRRAGAAAGMPFTIEAAYRVTDAPTGLPFVAIAWMDLGQAITAEQFGQAVMASHAQAQMQAELAPPAGGQGGGIGDPIWDAENRTVWQRSVPPSGGQPAPPFAWTASTLHPAGRTMLVFAYYGAPGEDEA
ncbi:MAG TPA: hypothetical protein VFR37_15065, partial [Longimicrobium sp.]|nr:hypothetical protein [Longimicrobium sp.]